MEAKILKTEAIILRATNYGEADRILQMITPQGKMSAIARGVRKEKAKLAGALAVFSKSEVVLRWGKSKMAMVTGAKLERYFGGLTKDIERLSRAGALLSEISKRAENADSEEWLSLLEEALGVLDEGEKGLSGSFALWWHLNTRRVSGEEVNLWTDVKGEKLKEDQSYFWNKRQEAMEKLARGSAVVEKKAELTHEENAVFSSKEIKAFRFLSSQPFALVKRIKDIKKLDESARVFLKLL